MTALLERVLYSSQPKYLVIPMNNSQFHNHSPYIGLACLQSWFYQCPNFLLVMISPYSTEFDTDNTSPWITVSHHPKDVIVISTNSPPDPDLSDKFVHPTVE